MAKLPQTLMKIEDPELQNIEIGETVYVYADAMSVTAEGMECYLLPTIRVMREKSFMHTLRVTRTADGFHVAILGKDKWTPDATQRSVAGWIPVASITVDYDPDVALADKAGRRP